MLQVETENQEKVERLIRLAALCAYPFKMKYTREDCEPYLVAVAKGKTVDTGSVEVSVSCIHGFVVWFRDGRRSKAFQQYYDEDAAALLIDAFCGMLGMQPKLLEGDA